MYKSLVALTFVAVLSGCAGTPRNSASLAEQCKMVAQDNSDSHIKVRSDCGSDQQTSPPAAGQPQQVGAN
ncbi:MAG TPA: hypothetical protein VF098_01815 [Sphingomicrobium sp.]|jgi:hypothetical protein